MEHFLISFGAMLFLFIVASVVNVFCKKMHIPYTVALFLVGLLLVPLAHTEIFHFLQTFYLTPELLFYVFLPILVFESGYNIKWRELNKNAIHIWGLAILGLLISAGVVGGLGYGIFRLLGIDIPFTVTLLFGAIISATDPVAVLALFKELGAPKRLTLLFEGESLFNDGTGLALFLVIFGVIQAINQTGSFSSDVIGFGVLSFLCMVFGGIALGFGLGVLFSHLIKKVTNNEAVEIGLTLVLGFLTFVLSDLIGEHVVIAGFAVKISGIIATAYAAIVMGNYGRTKISPKVEHHMEAFRGFFAHMANSLVFLLMGLMLDRLGVNLFDFLPHILIIIVVVIIARAVSVYAPLQILNKLRIGDYIPLAWQHLLAWGSLRGALVIMMVMLIPDDFTVHGWSFAFSVKQLLLALAMGCVMFTLFIKAPTMPLLMKKYKLTDLTPVEVLGQNQAVILMCLEVFRKLTEMQHKGYLTHDEYTHLRRLYDKKREQATKTITDLLAHTEKSQCNVLIHRALSLYALGIERQSLKDLFMYNQINEHIYRHYLHKLDKQTKRIEQGLQQVKSLEEKHVDVDYDLLDKLNTFFAGSNKHNDSYVKNRTKRIIASKVIKELKHLKGELTFYIGTCFDEVIELYEKFHAMADAKCVTFYAEDKNYVGHMNEVLTNKRLIQIEEKIAAELFEKEMISPKIYQMFVAQLEEEVVENK